MGFFGNHVKLYKGLLFIEYLQINCGVLLKCNTPKLWSVINHFVT